MADHIRDSRAREPHTSLLIHLDGAWGSGKSTLLNLLAKQLQPDDIRHPQTGRKRRHARRKAPFLIIWFDAWQQSRMSPPWWALLTATRNWVAHDLGWWRRRWFRIKETSARARRSLAPYVLAILLLLGAAGGLSYLIFGVIRPSQGWPEILKIIGGVGAVLATLWAGSRVASRVLLWDSARGARLFEKYETSPMADVAAHFDWLLRQSRKLKGTSGRKPIVFFVDDLDRCPDAYVVELLDSIQTLMRDACDHQMRGSERPPAAYFVVAADGAWLRQSYETAYKAFGQSVAPSGGSLGYLFLDKLFQLVVPMPALSTSAQWSYLGGLLGVAAPTNENDLTVAKAKIDEAVGDESAILDVMASLPEAQRAAVAPDAARALSSHETKVHTEHALRRFAPLLPPVPRSTKLFLNTYCILLAVRVLEGVQVNPDTLALWAIIRVRWPSIADYLHQNPEAIRGIHEPLWCTDLFPEPLHELAKGDALRAVVRHLTGGPLTAAAIRQCCGTAEEPTSGAP